MADKKITALNQLSSAIGSDVFPIVSISEGETKKISLADLMGSPGPIGTNTPSSARFSSLRLLSGASVTKFSVDGTLVSNSNDFVPTEQAVKTYVDTQIAGFVNHNSTLGLQGGNSSDEFYHLNENTYIGLYSSTNLIGLGNSSGTSFSVDYGSNSIIARISSNSYLTINNNGVKLQSGVFVNKFSIDGTLLNNSDSNIPTEKAVKTYVDSVIGTLVDHNNLLNLQGGDATSSEYYHLTENIYNGLFSGSPLIGLGNKFGTNLKVDYGLHDIIANINGDEQVRIDSDGLTLKTGGTVNHISNDSSFAGESDNVLVTQKAIKSFVTNMSSGGDNVRRVSIDTTAVALDVLLIDTTAGNVEIIMQGSINGRISVKKITTDANRVIVRSTSTIDGENEFVIETPYQAYSFLCNSGEFFIF